MESDNDEIINGDFVIPKHSYWRAFIDQNSSIIKDCFDLWPQKVKVTSVMKVVEVNGFHAHIEYLEFTFREKKGVLFRTDIDEIIKGESS